MSTLATADLGSDDEDADFVLPTKEPKSKRTRSGSDSESSGDEDDAEPEDDITAKLRQEAEDAAAEARKQRAAEAFKAMQEEVKAPKVASPAAKEDEVEMIEIRRPRRFAGETIYETVKLRKDDPEAVRYLAQQDAVQQETVDDASIAATAGSGSEVATPVPSTSASASPASSSSAPPPRRAPRKRPRQSLEAMSAALDKGKKMTTLEKSQMDWNSHMASETALADEVAQHRRGGGYLEKQAFLDRVGERRENAGSAQGTGRRR